MFMILFILLLICKFKTWDFCEPEYGVMACDWNWWRGMSTTVF